MEINFISNLNPVMHVILSVSESTNLEEKGKNYNDVKAKDPADIIPVFTDDIIAANEKSESDTELLKETIIKHISPMLHIDYQLEFEWISKFVKIAKPSKVQINDVVQLMPHRGLLKPNEMQYVHITFMPTTNINVRATLECEVLGGPTESVAVSGQSSDLIYKVNTQKVNFKIRSFHEQAYEHLIITNIAQLPFEYKTYLNEPKFETELEGTITNLIPPEKVLDPEEVAEVKILIRPGVIGYFKRIFLLEIGHLPHIPIEAFGWGVIPQVYLSLKRPEFADVIINFRIYMLLKFRL